MPEPVLTVQELRMHLGERIPNDGEEEDTNFTDNELQWILERSGGSFNLTMAIAWAAKAGIYTDLIDTNENGSDRKLDQMWKHCDKQATRFEKLAELEGAAIVADIAALRTGAVGFDAFCAAEEAHTISIFNEDSYYETRLYPLKRFPQVKQ